MDVLHYARTATVAGDGVHLERALKWHLILHDVLLRAKQRAGRRARRMISGELPDRFSAWRAERRSQLLDELRNGASVGDRSSVVGVGREVAQKARRMLLRLGERFGDDGTDDGRGEQLDELLRDRHLVVGRALGERLERTRRARRRLL